VTNQTSAPDCRSAVRDGVEGNARLTAAAAAVLLLLLAAEGATWLSVQSLLRAHVFIGFALIPPTLLKIGATGYRFARYYTGAAGYRGKGPPKLVLRLLGPVVILTTGALLASGVGLGLTRGSTRALLLSCHKASFVVWFAAMTVHVLGHALDVARVGPRDWRAAPRSVIGGVGARRWLIAVVIVVGCFAGVVGLQALGSWQALSG
jgi:hypothetical protein